MAVLVTGKIEENPIKSEVAIIRTTCSALEVYGKIFRRSRASNSKVNSPIWPKILLVEIVYKTDVFVTDKFDEAPVKNKVVIDRTTFSQL